MSSSFSDIDWIVVAFLVVLVNVVVRLNARRCCCCCCCLDDDFDDDFPNNAFDRLRAVVVVVGLLQQHAEDARITMTR